MLFAGPLCVCVSPFPRSEKDLSTHAEFCVLREIANMRRGFCGETRVTFVVRRAQSQLGRIVCVCLDGFGRLSRMRVQTRRIDTWGTRWGLFDALDGFGELNSHDGNTPNWLGKTNKIGFRRIRAEAWISYEIRLEGPRFYWPYLRKDGPKLGKIVK